MTKDKTVGVPTGFKVKLSYTERMNLPELYPPKGDRLELQLMEQINSRIELSPGDKDFLKFRSQEYSTDQGPVTRWDWDVDLAKKEKTFEFTKTEMEFLKGCIKKLDDKKQLPLRVWPVVKKLDGFKVGEEKE